VRGSVMERVVEARNTLILGTWDGVQAVGRGRHLDWEGKRLRAKQIEKPEVFPAGLEKGPHEQTREVTRNADEDLLLWPEWVDRFTHPWLTNTDSRIIDEAHDCVLWMNMGMGAVLVPTMSW
jgi:hypothetical protein